MKFRTFVLAILTLSLLSTFAAAQKKTGSDLRDAVTRVEKPPT